ncbi:hypothetical protein GCM10011501_24600 [Thalassotalea profundi]|uniref:Uncharacterized protein n=2 Tax=Thalassotalea profundi TaxID=2036687 RepID=A0ABQ3IZ12_9GAMM|nr:hypothetical protein GCM10011501_24600 [Thalassotalea profundi]
MEQPKVDRLNDLFEKVLANSANSIEKHELGRLYKEFIDDGRDNKQRKYEPSSKKYTAFNQ